MEERKMIEENETSFEKLRKVLEEHKAKYEVITGENEAGSYQYTYLLYYLPVARGYDEIRVYDNDPNIDAIINSDFLKYRGIESYEAIYSADMKSIECEVQAGRVYSASHVIDRLSRCLGHEVIGEDKAGERDNVVLYCDDKVKVSVGKMSTELAFLSGYKRGRRHIYDISKHTIGASVKIESIECKTEDIARKVLEKIANSIFYQIDMLYSIPVTLSSRRESRDEMLRKSRTRVERKPDVTELQLNYEYDRIPMSLYWFAQNNSNSPFFRYFALYQVLEYYLPVYAAENLKTRMRLLIKDPLFNINDDADVLRLVDIIKSNDTENFGDEREQLIFTIKSVTDSESIMQYISDREYLIEYYKGKQATKVSDKKLRTGDKDAILTDLASRIYDIRCRIVHNKASESHKKILPLSKEESYLSHDIELLQFIARKAIIANSRPINLI